MSIARGSKSAFRIKIESSYGVAPVGDWDEYPIVSETFGMTINEVMSQEIRSDRKTPNVRGGNKAAGGQMVMDWSMSRFGILLAHLMGPPPTTTSLAPTLVADTTAYVRGDVVKNANSGGQDYLCIIGGTTSGTSAADLTGTVNNQRITSGSAIFVYFGATATAKKKHVFATDNDLPPVGLALEKAILGGNDPTYLTFVGGRVDSLQLQIPQEGIVQATWSFLFAKEVTETGVTGAGTPVVKSEAGVTGFESYVSIAGSTGAVREGNITISNALDPDIFVVGERTRHDITPKTRAVTGSLTAFFANNDDLERWLAEESFDLKLSFFHDQGFCEIDMPECKFFGDVVPKVSGSGALTLTFNFHAFVSTQTKDVEITLKNTTTAYVTE